MKRKKRKLRFVIRVDFKHNGAKCFDGVTLALDFPDYIGPLPARLSVKEFGTLVRMFGEYFVEALNQRHAAFGDMPPRFAKLEIKPLRGYFDGCDMVRLNVQLNAAFIFFIAFRRWKAGEELTEAAAESIADELCDNVEFLQDIGSPEAAAAVKRKHRNDPERNQN